MDMHPSWTLWKLNALTGRRRKPLWIISCSLFCSPWVALSKVPPQQQPQAPRLSFIFRHDKRPFTTSLLPAGMSSAKLDHPSSQRNKGPIWEVLSSQVIPSLVTTTTREDKKPRLRILEVAAGTGVHTDHFATQLVLTTSIKNNFVWYPTDPSQESRTSIQCYIEDNPLLVDIVKPPLSLTLDIDGIMEEATASALLDEGPLDLITCINMIHISPWDATLGLMKIAGQNLSPNGCLYCYGPYKVGGTAAESNLNFDRSLQSRDPRWGVRDLEAVCEAAAEQGLELSEKMEMPANNLSLLFRRRPGQS